MSQCSTPLTLKQQYAKVRLAMPHLAGSLVGVAWMGLKFHGSSLKPILKDGSFFTVIVGALELDYSGIPMEQKLLITRCIFIFLGARPHSCIEAIIRKLD